MAQFSHAPPSTFSASTYSTPMPPCLRTHLLKWYTSQEVEAMVGNYTLAPNHTLYRCSPKLPPT